MDGCHMALEMLRPWVLWVGLGVGCSSAVVDTLPRSDLGLEPPDAQSSSPADGGLESVDGEVVGDGGIAKVRSDSSCFGKEVDSTHGRFVELTGGSSYGKDNRDYLVVSEPSQQGCLWVQGGVNAALVYDGLPAPNRRGTSTVWACNACDEAVQISLLARYRGLLKAEDVFLQSQTTPRVNATASDGPLIWPNGSTYRTNLIKDSVTRVDFPDGSAFSVGCTEGIKTSGGTFRKVLEPDESINFVSSWGRHSAFNPPQDLPDAWQAPPSGLMRLMPSVHVGFDPLQIPELLPRTCGELGFEELSPGDFSSCSGHCLIYEPDDYWRPEFRLDWEHCPYECPQVDPSIQIEIPLQGPYPEGLFYGKQSWN